MLMQRGNRVQRSGMQASNRRPVGLKGMQPRTPTWSLLLILLPLLRQGTVSRALLEAAAVLGGARGAVSLARSRQEVRMQQQRVQQML
jgi:hypothetical protein